MVVTLATWELLLPGSGSLKDKRSVLRSLKDRLARMNVSVAETGMQDLRGRARISVVFLSAEDLEAEIAGVADEDAEAGEDAEADDSDDAGSE